MTIILTFTDERDSFTVCTSRGKEAIALVTKHSPSSLWPMSWPDRDSVTNRHMMRYIGAKDILNRANS